METVVHTLDNFGLRCGTHKGVLGHIHIKVALQNETSRRERWGLWGGIVCGRTFAPAAAFFATLSAIWSPSRLQIALWKEEKASCHKSKRESIMS
jgi:hypothetical protein